VRSVFERYEETARERSVALVPAAGFDYALGDCIARLVARAVEPAAELVVAYALDGPDVSANSARGAIESDHGGEVVYRDGAWRRPPLGVQRASFCFPAPTGRRPVTRYGSGEIITVPRHSRVRTVISLVTTSTFAPHPLLIPAFPFLRPAAALALRTPLRRLLERAAARTGSTGSREPDRRNARFVIAAIARGEDGAAAGGAVYGADFHGITAIALAYAAKQLADAGFDRSGVLGPAAAYDPEAFLDHLGSYGVSWELHKPP
jgi:short subunit dehydrogenase-like uncharacterized protein